MTEVSPCTARLTYDHTVPGASAAWRDACLNLTVSGDIDGAPTASALVIMLEGEEGGYIHQPCARP